MARSLLRWLLGLIGTSGITALAWWGLVSDPLLLSTLWVAWFAGLVGITTQRGTLPLFRGGGWWGRVFAGVTTFVAASLPATLPISSEQAFAVSVIVLGFGLFAVSAGSGMTTDANDAD